MQCWDYQLHYCWRTTVYHVFSFLLNTHDVLTSTLHFTIRILRILLDLVTTFASPFAQLLKKKKKIQTSKEHSHDHDRFFVWKTSGPLTLRSPLDYRLFVIFNATNANNVNDSFEQTASYQIYASTFSWINYKVTNKNREKTFPCIDLSIDYFFL